MGGFDSGFTLRLCLGEGRKREGAREAFVEVENAGAGLAPSQAGVPYPISCRKWCSVFLIGGAVNPIDPDFCMGP